MPIATPPDPQAAALLSHVLSQIQQSISFLSDNHYISDTQAADLRAPLALGPPSSSRTSFPDAVVPGMQNLSVGPARVAEPARRIPPPPPRNNVQKATAIWAYNEDGREPNDLSFSAGEVVEIVDETNDDWWTGQCRGKQGLFPSNHVQKIDNPNPSRSPAPPPPFSVPSMPNASSYHSYQPPPPQQYGMPHDSEKVGMYQSHYAPPVPVQGPPPPVQVVQQPAEPPKKNMFGKLGNTMATSAAGGVGFGAGAAIGSGLVNAIF